MKIFSKEVLEFTQDEGEALYQVTVICADLIQKANDPNLRELAREIHGKIMDLWGYEDENE